MESKARKLRFATGLALGVAVLTAGVIEGLLRVGVLPNLPYMMAESERLWLEADRRVLVIGDSFFARFAGTGRLFAAALAEEGIAVKNLAVSGTGPFEYLERLQSADREPGPDIVLLGYYVGNDLTDVQRNPKHDKREKAVAIKLEAPVAKTRNGLLDAFYLSRLLRKPEVQPQRIPWQQIESAGFEPGLLEAARAGRISPWLFLLSLRTPNYLMDNILMETEENQRAWEKSREVLSAIQDEATARGARLLVVVFPRSIQIDDSHFDFFRSLKFRVEERCIGTRRPQDLMASFCAERGIEMLDLLPAFQARHGEDLYKDLDDHFDAEGHRLAAECIASFVTSQLEP